MNLDIKDFLIIDDSQNAIKNTFLSNKNINEIKSITQYIFSKISECKNNLDQIKYEFNFDLDINNLYKTNVLDDIRSEIYSIKIYYKDSIINLNKFLLIINEEIGYIYYDSGSSELVSKRNTKEFTSHNFIKVIFNEKDIINKSKNYRKPLKIYKNGKRL